MNPIYQLYQKLRRDYGAPKGQWSLWCKRPKSEKEREEVIIGAVLTQRTNWRNVEKALLNLKKERKNYLKEILKLKKQSLEKLIKPCGFYRSKAQYLLNLSHFVIKTKGGVKKMKKAKLEELRKELLKLKGIGKETADSILLYALDKPIFVIDEYTRRFAKKYSLSKDFSYHFLQRLFEEHLRKDFRLYQDFHALIVIEGQTN